jgi:hypothetical protein
MSCSGSWIRKCWVTSLKESVLVAGDHLQLSPYRQIKKKPSGSDLKSRCHIQCLIGFFANEQEQIKAFLCLVSNAFCNHDISSQSLYHKKTNWVTDASSLLDFWKIFLIFSKYHNICAPISFFIDTCGFGCRSQERSERTRLFSESR